MSNHSATLETVRPASFREKTRNGFGPTGETVCHWCGDEAADQVVYESWYLGQTYSSPAYCGEACHVEACTEGAF